MTKNHTRTHTPKARSLRSDHSARKSRKNQLSTSHDSWYNQKYQEEMAEELPASLTAREMSRYEIFWQNLTITDDFIFGKIMLDPELCMELLRRIFPGRQIERIEYIRTQESIQLDKESKGIRLDVFVRDNQDVAFCVEMQTRNVDNLAKRSRYYQSLVDLELLDRGQAYDDLSPSYVIFISPTDLFGRGYHVYEFRNCCIRDRELELGDQATKIFLNAKGTADDVDPPLKEFLDYVAGREHEETSEFIVKLKVALHHAKQNREWRRQRMILYFRDQDVRADALKEGRAEGRVEGRAEKEREMICSMLANGIDREAIKKVAEITDEELDEILNS